MKHIKAVIFDFDGTILDTYEFVSYTFERSLATFEVHIERSELDAFSGQTVSDIYLQLLPLESIEDALAKHREIQLLPGTLELIRSYDAAHELLQRLREKQVKCAVLSNRMHASLVNLLEHAGFESSFDAVFGGDEVAVPKPDPGGVYKVCKALDVSPEDTVMIGDTVHDVQAGKNAGVLASVGITHGFNSQHQLEQAGADYIVDSLAEFEVLLGRLNNGED